MDYITYAFKDKNKVVIDKDQFTNLLYLYYLLKEQNNVLKQEKDALKNALELIKKTVSKYHKRTSKHVCFNL